MKYPARILFIKTESPSLQEVMLSAIDFSGEATYQISQQLLEENIDKHYHEIAVVEGGEAMYNGQHHREKKLNSIFASYQDKTEHRSMMVGDVVQYPLDGTDFYVVSPIGWEHIHLPTAEDQDR